MQCLYPVKKKYNGVYVILVKKILFTDYIRK